MKIIVIAALACILMISCKKNNLEGQQLLTGNWELRQSAGGIAGTLQYEPGNGTVYTFDTNRNYRFTFNNSPAQAGTYEIKESAHYGHWLLQLQYVWNNKTVNEKYSFRFDAG